MNDEDEDDVTLGIQWVSLGGRREGEQGGMGLEIGGGGNRTRSDILQRELC